MKNLDAVIQKIESLDSERRRLQEKIQSLTYTHEKNDWGTIRNHVEKWDEVSFEDKQSVADTVIKVIHIADGNVEITWKI